MHRGVKQFTEGSNNSWRGQTIHGRVKKFTEGGGGIHGGVK